MSAGSTDSWFQVLVGAKHGCDPRHACRFLLLCGYSSLLKGMLSYWDRVRLCGQLRVAPPVGFGHQASEASEDGSLSTRPGLPGRVRVPVRLVS